jgi:DnaJ family protein C protein 19
MKNFKFNYAKRFYEGGFEATMSKREAALILGCRQTADKEKVMDRYRTLMKLNHPDFGGSPFLAQKINEAKDMLSTSSSKQSGPSGGQSGAPRARRAQRD